MDAFASLSLASTLMQFSEYASRLLDPAPQLYKPARGFPTDKIYVEALVQDLLALKQSLRRQPPPRHTSASYQDPRTDSPTALEVLHSRSLTVAQDLLAHLTRLRHRATGAVQHVETQRKTTPDRWRSMLGADGLEAMDSQQQPEMMQFQTWHSFHRALRATWERQEEIVTLEDSIWGIRRGIESRILVSFRDALAHLANSFYNSEEAFITQIQVQSQRLLQLGEFEKVSNDDNDPLGISLDDILRGIGSLRTPEHGTIRKTPRIANARVESELHTLIVETCILDSLAFTSMIERRETVERAHARTFNWIYQDTDAATAAPGGGFVDWLRRGHGIYWISGKVGCGKSTLIRFLCENEATRRALAAWAGRTTPCELYSFFFWNSGAESQRSLAGLLRSLLFDMLRRHRGLMHRVVPEAVRGAWAARAEAALEGNLPYDSALLQPPEPDTLTVPELEDTFQRTLEALTGTGGFSLSTKLCFFIDGLDEYGAEHPELVGLLNRWAALPGVKFCLSSRPLRVFEEAFSGLPTLRLQDLTHGDLSHYVRDRLCSQPRMRQLLHHPRAAAAAAEVSTLIQDAVSKSQGVFLWVKLAVQSLVLALPSCDDGVAGLRRHVDRLPGDLDDLFAHLIAHRDHAHAARLLQIFLAARRQAPEKVTLLQLSLADDEDELLAEDAPVRRMPIAEVAARCQATDAELQGTCAGLLEAHESKYSSAAPDAKVLVLHRTVSDWLARPDVQVALVAQTASAAGGRFSPSLALVRSHVLRLKGLDVDSRRPLDMGLVADAVAHARNAEEELGAGFPALFDQLDLAVAYQFRQGDCRAVYGVDDNDDLSDTSSDDGEAADTASDGSASPAVTPSQLTSYLQSYRASMMASQSGIFSTMSLGPRSSQRRPPPSQATAPLPENALAASYIAHRETRFSGVHQGLPPPPPPQRTRRVGTDHHHWAWCLEVSVLIPLHAAVSFHDVARLAGLRHYTAAKADASALDRDVAQHLLHRAVTPASARPTAGSVVDPVAVADLLAGGADPNFAFNDEGPTPWEAALAAAASHFAATTTAHNDIVLGAEELEAAKARHKKGCEDWIAVVGSFLRHGADPYAEARVLDLDRRPVVSACEVLESYAPRFLEEEVVALMELLAEKRAEVDRKKIARTRTSPGVDIEGKSPVLSSSSSVAWPMSWIPIRDSFV
ncbi:hypothetical protein ISF_06193 [Cordyceps fumosorosea ARSEF 2679]|uniref:Uncharacterized protein n=1 Tax=Cordyceps fumosorosea (strain ARSEF 2679) TaxID=1081104 RepID=A0A167S527_CORFA|nr:hypothetical protein ISF_06193 [Cordyceps fumosorosea ARSEF 2679]OAA59258.1 hypothetical protein ISF_06193 [Cordyceps fumosorosea ARSEF 2679]